MQRGQTLEVYGTGLGAVVQRDGLQVVVAKVEALVNDAVAEVQFSGLAPGFVGLYQVNVAAPAGVTGEVRTKLRVGTVESNEVKARVQ